MAAKRKARKSRYQPSEDVMSRANKAKAKDVDYSREFRQIGFLGHLGSIHKSKKAVLKVAPSYGRDNDDSLPLLVLGFAALALGAAIFALAFMDIPDVPFRFRP